MPKTLIACIGNIFLGDDAFGCAVASRLASHKLPSEVRVVDFGIRGLDLTYALLEDWEQVIVVDAVPRGGTPGTLYIIEPELSDMTAEPQPTALDAHEMDPLRALRLAITLGAKLPKLRIVGCEPSPVAEHDLESGLSAAVECATEAAADLVESLIEKQPTVCSSP